MGHPSNVDPGAFRQTSARSGLHIESGAATHVGRRPNNEDSYLVAPELALFAVADGLGGQEGGEVASAIVVRVIYEAVAEHLRRAAPPENPPGAVVSAAVQRAHDEVKAQQSGRLAQMGSTVTALLIANGEAHLGNVGDSRGYLLREGALYPLTRDHSLLAELIASGRQLAPAARALYRSTLTQSVGMEGPIQPDCFALPIRPGDVYLLCSDGVWEPVPPSTIAAVLAEGSAEDAARRLVHEAYERGGTDNMTAVVVRTN